MKKTGYEKKVAKKILSMSVCAALVATTVDLSAFASFAHANVGTSRGSLYNQWVQTDENGNEWVQTDENGDDWDYEDWNDIDAVQYSKVIILDENTKTYSMDELFGISDSCGGKITYVNKNTDIVDVDDNGNITIKQIGTARIEAKTEKIGNYQSMRRSFYIKVRSNTTENIYYFDNSLTQWDNVYVWAWNEDDDMWDIDNGFQGWPGIELEPDEETGLYAYEISETDLGVNVMFDDGGGQQTNNYAACSSIPGYVCSPFDIDEYGQYDCEWFELDGYNTEKYTINCPQTKYTFDVVDENYVSTFNVGVTVENNGKANYTSTNTKIATVDEKGNVTLTGKVGNANIKVISYGDGSYRKDIKYITIKVRDSSKMICYYFDNSIVKWDEVNVWAWSNDDEMWAFENGFSAWPGIELDIDPKTGYYVYQAYSDSTDINVMFNDGINSYQTTDNTAMKAEPGCVLHATGFESDGHITGKWLPVELGCPEGIHEINCEKTEYNYSITDFEGLNPIIIDPKIKVEDGVTYSIYSSNLDVADVNSCGIITLTGNAGEAVIYVNTDTDKDGHGTYEEICINVIDDSDRDTSTYYFDNSETNFEKVVLHIYDDCFEDPIEGSQEIANWNFELKKYKDDIYYIKLPNKLIFGTETYYIDSFLTGYFKDGSNDDWTSRILWYSGDTNEINVKETQYDEFEEEYYTYWYFVPIQDFLGICMHNKGNLLKDSKNSSCTEEGYTGDYYCTECDTLIKEGEVIPKVDHIFGEYVSNNDATCKADGTKTATCTLGCGKTDTVVDEGSKKEHVPAAKKVNASVATCTKEGYTGDVVCKNCKTVITKGKKINKVAHVYNNYTTKATAATQTATAKNGSIVTKCTVCGAKKSTTVIYYPKTLTLSKTSFVYDKTAKKPTVKVVDAKGNTIKSTNYVVTYSNNINVGTSIVTVTMKGNYSGKLTASFKITQAANNLSVTKTEYTKVALATNQYINLGARATGGTITYASSNSKVTVSKTGRVTIPKNYAGKVTITVTVKDKNYKTVTKKVVITVKPAKEKIVSLTNTVAGRLTVKWNKLAYVTGYEIQYATNKNFSGTKKVAVNGATTVIKNITGLKKGTTYFVRVRAYKTANGTKLYGEMSDVKSLKIKK